MYHYEITRSKGPERRTLVVNGRTFVSRRGQPCRISSNAPLSVAQLADIANNQGPVSQVTEAAPLTETGQAREDFLSEVPAPPKKSRREVTV